MSRPGHAGSGPSVSSLHAATKHLSLGVRLSASQCTVEMYGDKLEFLIKALWIAHFR